MNKRMKNIAITVLIIASFTSCINKEDYDSNKFTKTSWNPVIGFPLIKSKLGVSNLMGNSDPNAVTTAADGLVVLKYQSGSQIIKASDFVQFPGNVFLKSPNNVPLNFPGTYPISIPFDTTLGVIFSKVIIESGSLELSFDVNSNKGAQAKFNFQSILNNQNGDTLEMNVSIEPNAKEIRDLSGHSILIDASGNFLFEIKTPAGLSGSANPVFEFKNLVYKRIEGDFKSKKVIFPVDSLELFIFQNLASQGELYVDDPRIVIDINNGFGVPMDINLGSLEGYNSISGISTKVLKPSQGTFNIKEGSAQSPEFTKIKIDKTNSDLSEVLKPTPMFFKYGAVAQANPNSSGKNSNSIDAAAVLDVKTILELPLKGRIKGLAIIDTVPFGVNESFDLVNEMTVTTVIQNGFPFTITLSLKLMDENYLPVLTKEGNPVYLVKDREIASSGTVNSSTGRIDQNNLITKINNYEIGLSETQELLKGVYVRIEGRIETFNNGDEVIGIYSDYIFDLKVGVKITGNLTF